jgi:hypothetical protein
VVVVTVVINRLFSHVFLFRIFDIISSFEIRCR